MSAQTQSMAVGQGGQRGLHARLTVVQTAIVSGIACARHQCSLIMVPTVLGSHSRKCSATICLPVEVSYIALCL